MLAPGAVTQSHSLVPRFTSSGITPLIAGDLWGPLLSPQSAARLLLSVRDLGGSKSTGLMYGAAPDQPVAAAFMKRSKQNRAKVLSMS